MTPEPAFVFNVTNSSGLSFGNPINELFRIVRYVEANKNNRITVSLKHCRFGSPVILLGIKMLEQFYQRKGYAVEIDPLSFSRDFNGYLACIGFQEMLLPDRFSPDAFKDHIGLYIEKTYFPMVSFPARLTDIASIYREYLLDAIGAHLKNRLALSGGMYQAISYLLDEIVNNVKDHSREEKGYIFTQFYPSRGLLDICIGDLGIQFMGSYQNIGRTELDANVLGSWPGTLVSMRIPYQGSTDFNFYEFVE